MILFKLNHTTYIDTDSHKKIINGVRHITRFQGHLIGDYDTKDSVSLPELSILKLASGYAATAHPSGKLLWTIWFNKPYTEAELINALSM